MCARMGWENRFGFYPYQGHLEENPADQSIGGSRGKRHIGSCHVMLTSALRLGNLARQCVGYVFSEPGCSPIDASTTVRAPSCAPQLN